MSTNILDNIDLRKLGERLQQSRKKSGMTQAEAAKVDRCCSHYHCCY